MSGWADPACESCHVAEPVFSHPVRVVPDLVVPSDLPLVDGKLACITCHAMDTTSDHIAARRHGGPALRGGLSGPELCLRCHQSTNLDRRALHVAMLGGRAHMVPAATYADDPATTLTAAAGVDEASAICMGCHDGSVATAAGHDGPGTLAQRLPLGMGHPVGIDYPSRERLLPPSSLDPRIRLFDRRVGCLSCHSPFSSLSGLLVMPNRGSKLCLGCHDF